jgi:nitrite reductase/ring-hydroxylating ferredoxin subunit
MTEFQRLAPIERIVPGRITLAFLGTTRVAITRVASGEVRVFNNACPHAGSPLSGGRVCDGQVECPRHGWRFDLDSGACVTSPEYALRVYESRLRDGWVEARKPDEIW